MTGRLYLRDGKAKVSVSPAPKEPPIRDRPFDPWRSAKSPSAKAIVADIINELEHYEEHKGLRQRRRKATDQKTFELMIEAIVCDAMYCTLASPDRAIMTPMSKEKLSRANRYRAPALNKTFPEALKRLASKELSFLRLKEGYRGAFGPGRRTTCTAGWRLLKLMRESEITLGDLRQRKGREIIVLKGAKEGRLGSKQTIAYAETPATIRLRSDLEMINTWLDEAELNFDEGLETKHPVDIDDRSMRRMFNNGAFNQGGRLFGGFWQGLKKEERASGLLIDDEEVVTIDYRQMSARTLYGLCGATPPADCYAVPGYEIHREGWKKLWNAALFNGPVFSRMPANTRPLFPNGLAISDALKLLLKFHKPVATKIVPDLGFSLQYVESNILVEVLLSLMSKGVVALPVHDAVIVKASDADVTETAMVNIFKKHTGLIGQVSRE
ncbi:hypothetical protein F2P47_07530 [Parvibaculum sedimenti]|uniref:DNA-directed DNA polymerase family A palm domain-containing protein n=1 Tax=Parvibaculum sedimenti TaxID=2608632 RepID=A0A6N6VK88_9HYPH|nr:hypothetical protein [Parvibaculum sedimenti]KAB7740375.1 hypothetical protein F2P47_07530 [Parvibaculum sedimenti]